MSYTESKIAIGALTLNYVEQGEGEVIIFLHNGGGFWQSWEHQISHFSKHFKVIALDWPGFGSSESSEGLLSLENLYSTLKKFIEIKGLKKVHLVGNCIGASTAYLYNIRNPEKVNKLVLFNICPGDLIFPKLMFRSFIPKLNGYPNSKRIAEQFLKFAFIKTPLSKKFPSILFAKNYNPHDSLFVRYIEKFKEKQQTLSRINLLFSVHTFTFDKYLRTKKPIKHLLLWGAQNSVTNYHNHGLYHKNLLRSEQFALIENGGHLCMYESPEITNKLIKNYLQKS